MKSPTDATKEVLGEGESVQEVLRLRSRTLRDIPVLLAPNRQPLTWAALGAQLDYVGEFLGGLGIGGADRIAVVLPDGPELASAFLTVSACATFAPLNPAYGAGEFAGH